MVIVFRPNYNQKKSDLGFHKLQNEHGFLQWSRWTAIHALSPRNFATIQKHFSIIRSKLQNLAAQFG